MLSEFQRIDLMPQAVNCWSIGGISQTYFDLRIGVPGSNRIAQERADHGTKL
jgi:hypothetical protein